MTRARRGGRDASGPRTDGGPLVVYGANPVLELLRSGEPLERLCLGGGPREAELAAAARKRGVRVESVDRAGLARLAGSSHHQGAVAVTPPFRYAPFERLLAPECGSVLLLDGMQDPRNLGAILRTARAAGVGGVVLPRDRSVGITSVAAAASAGLLFGLPIARVTNLARAMRDLKEAGFWLLALLPRGGRDLRSLARVSRPGLVVGGEGEGLRPLVRASCDLEASIPMAPGVDSLNVAVAAGIALYELLIRPQPS